MSGPKPIPTALKILRGNPGRHRLNDEEPQPNAIALPATPKDLDAAALGEWNERGPMLERLGLLTEADIPAFETYCRAWGRYQDAEVKLKLLGEVVKAPSGYPIQNPYRSVANRALAQCQHFWAAFGMTPADRSRVHVKKGNAPPASKLQKFMRVK